MRIQTELFDRGQPVFFNTIGHQGADLENRKLNAGSQNAKILKLFQDNPNTNYTPTEVFRHFHQEQWPITSIRRSITNLTDQGKLQKTDTRRPGLYGELNFAWKLA